MDTRREFLKKSMLLSGAAGFSRVVPASIQKALNIDPKAGSTYLDAEHIVILMQENRSFDHCFGTLQGVRGYNDPRIVTLPNDSPVWLQSDERNDTYAPFRLDIKKTKITWMGSLPHVRQSQVDAYNAGKHDKWLFFKKSGNKKYATMPLTLGYYNREDLPFNYALADAFTVCDQNFCAAMTSTTPNRAYFWTANIKEELNGKTVANIRNEEYKFATKKWPTFPELLQDHNISWKFYQNEITCGGGFKGEEGSWLGNFGCNNLEWFEAYNVILTPRYINKLQALTETLSGEISELQQVQPAGDKEADKLRKAIAKKQEVLQQTKEQLAKIRDKGVDSLSAKEKALFKNAFVVNDGDPNYRTVTTLSYNDSSEGRALTVPAGDVLYQFRKDVQEGKLPTVSWLAGPQNFSDHPSAPWYGAWYVSEILDILTQNPEVWQKTIFILTYDENDGYFDHIPPFTICDNKKPETGKCSPGIDTEAEWIRMENELGLGVKPKAAREAPIGLGFRVPMVIASPWSRGGKVCSQLFEHTSTLQFLETFINKKYNKQLHFDNISAWRRAISGDLTSAFTPFEKKQDKLPFLDRNKFVEEIYNAKFMQVPADYVRLDAQQIRGISADPLGAALLPKQEPGIRPSSALPYELYVHGQLSNDKKHFEASFSAGNHFFGEEASGSPFTVYAPVVYEKEKCRNWSFAAKPGDTLGYQWKLSSFDNKSYHLRAHAPNGFFREFTGDSSDPQLSVQVNYQKNRLTGKLTGNIELKLISHAPAFYDASLEDNGYNKNSLAKRIAPGEQVIVMDLQKSFGWYDFTLKIEGFDKYAQRFAGRVETGRESFTDPVMGKVQV